MPRLRPLKEEPKKPEDAKPQLEAAQEKPEIEIIEDPKPAPKKESPKPDEAALALQKQLEQLQKSEEQAKRRAETADRERREAIQRAESRDVEFSKLQKESAQSKAESVAATIAAATSEISAAKVAIKEAIGIGDVDAQTEAVARLSEAQNSLAGAKTLQVSLEEAAKREPEKPVQRQLTPEDAAIQSIESMGIPRTAKEWLKNHSDYLTEPRKNAKINALHWDVLDEGHEAYSPAYIESMEIKLGLKKAPPKEDDVDETEEEDTKSKVAIVSAPVTREAPGNSGGSHRPSKVSLTRAQVEAANIAGVTVEEYAKQLQVLSERKANGDYTGRP